MFFLLEDGPNGRKIYVWPFGLVLFTFFVFFCQDINKGVGVKSFEFWGKVSL